MKGQRPRELIGIWCNGQRASICILRDISFQAFCSFVSHNVFKFLYEPSTTIIGRLASCL